MTSSILNENYSLMRETMKKMCTRKRRGRSGRGEDSTSSLINRTKNAANFLSSNSASRKWKRSSFSVWLYYDVAKNDSRRHDDDVRQAGPTNIMHDLKNFCRHCHMAPGVCATAIYWSPSSTLTVPWHSSPAENKMETKFLALRLAAVVTCCGHLVCSATWRGEVITCNEPHGERLFGCMISTRLGWLPVEKKISLRPEAVLENGH